MYNAFFGFRKNPFASTPDPEFFFRSKHHDAALKGLLLSIEARMGLVSLVGDEGTGKTVVLECLRNALGPDVPCAFVRDSRISFGRFLQTIASDLNLDLRSKTKSTPQVFLALTRLTAEQARSGRTVVLIVDDAHNLPANVFDEIVHTASLRHDNVKAIQTIFASRPEMQPRLAALNPDRVGQRAILSRSLSAFTARETKEYVEFRLACAGMPKQTVFPRKTLEEIYQRSQGFAPAIHFLCERLLLAAFSATSKVCTQKIRDEIFKSPLCKLSQIMEAAPIVVASARIEPFLLAPPPAPEPPPLHTALLRVAVDSRLGSLHPRPVRTAEWPTQLAAIKHPWDLPGGRLVLADAELNLGSIQPMFPTSFIKASVLTPSMDFGFAHSSVPFATLIPCLPVGVLAKAHPPSAPQLPVGKLITPERYVKLGPALTSAHSPAAPFPELFSHALQPMYATANLQPASVIPYSQVALTLFPASNHDALPACAGRFVEAEPANLTPDERPGTTALGDFLHPSIGTPITLLPLPFSAQAFPPPARAPFSPFSITPPPLPLRPKSGLKPADPSRPRFLSLSTWISRSASHKIIWASPTEVFTASQKRLASYGKPLVALILPILGSLALYNALPVMRVAADTARQSLQRTQGVVISRAAVTFDEDFRAGLNHWTNRGGSPPAWTSDASGFIHPGALALYRPSLSMVDYQVQFLGTIDKKGLSWVARAADFDNYYAIRLAVVKPGPLPLIAITRYAVIHGVPQKRFTTPLFMSAQADTVYRVNLDIQGDRFALSIQDQPVDSWSEPRLGRGTIGFFSEKEAASRIASLHVRGHYDMLGRLCAFLMPSGPSDYR